MSMYIGHDAELAVLDEKGEAVSAHRFFPPKDQPLLTNPNASKEFHPDQIFRDGTSLEVNTGGGVSCIATMLSTTRQSLYLAQAKLPVGYRLAPLSSYQVEEDLMTAPADVLESGCGPVRNAYEGWEERPAMSQPLSKQRFAGGHIHLCPAPGYSTIEPLLEDEKKRQEVCPYIVKYLDLFLGVPYLYTGVEGAVGAERRRVYGKAGEYRFQTYKWPAGWGKTVDGATRQMGIEYRVLGPEWLKELGLAGMVFMLARGITWRALARWKEREQKKAKTVRWSSMLQEAREAINLGDTKAIFESPAYQKKFQRVLTTALSPGRFKIEHFKFIRENQERLFKRTSLITEAAYDTHQNWPQCLNRWQYKEAAVGVGVRTQP